MSTTQQFACNVFEHVVDQGLLLQSKIIFKPQENTTEALYIFKFLHEIPAVSALLRSSLFRHQHHFVQIHGLCNYHQEEATFVNLRSPMLAFSTSLLDSLERKT